MQNDVPQAVDIKDELPLFVLAIIATHVRVIDAPNINRNK